MNTTWQDLLIARHPRLFLATLAGREYAPGHPVVGDGWQHIVETAVGRIVTAAGNFPVRIAQIKSKYGTIRIYWEASAALPDAITDGIEEAIALAEARSACTCETCGEEGRLYAAGDWLTTACSDHARGVSVAVKAGWENLHIVRTYSAGSPRIIACRRYIRATDSFVDMSPSDLGIED
jgi:hypothetical protein